VLEMIDATVRRAKQGGGGVGGAGCSQD
jgi:hypothetical protein